MIIGRILGSLNLLQVRVFEFSLWEGNHKLVGNLT